MISQSSRVGTSAFANLVPSSGFIAATMSLKRPLLAAFLLIPRKIWISNGFTTHCCDDALLLLLLLLLVVAIVVVAAVEELLLLLLILLVLTTTIERTPENICTWPSRGTHGTERTRRDDPSSFSPVDSRRSLRHTNFAFSMMLLLLLICLPLPLSPPASLRSSRGWWLRSSRKSASQT